MNEPLRTQPEESEVKILCVDDEPNILSALRRTLTSFGYKVISAKSGQEGLKLLQRESVQLVISDMRMPGMDGVSFLEYVSVRWPDTVRVLLTGYSSLDSTIDAVNRGHVYCYIAKPWDDDDLKVTVSQALHHYDVVMENKRLADQVRAQQNQMLEQQREIEELKQRHPSLMSVDRDSDGSISIGDDDEEDTDH